MDIIRTYEKGSFEYIQLQLACYYLMLKNTHGTKYSVQNIYFDLGQGWKWTTIIAHHKDGRSWQAINPAQQEKIILYGNDVEKAVDEIINYEYHYDPD